MPSWLSVNTGTTWIAGTCLWRVHAHRYPASGFNVSLADTLYGGARFDATAVAWQSSYSVTA